MNFVCFWAIGSVANIFGTANRKKELKLATKKQSRTTNKKPTSNHPTMNRLLHEPTNSALAKIKSSYQQRRTLEPDMERRKISGRLLHFFVCMLYCLLLCDSEFQELKDWLLWGWFKIKTKSTTASNWAGLLVDEIDTLRFCMRLFIISFIVNRWPRYWRFSDAICSANDRFFASIRLL